MLDEKEEKEEKKKVMNGIRLGGKDKAIRKDYMHKRVLRSFNIEQRGAVCLLMARVIFLLNQNWWWNASQLVIRHFYINDPPLSPRLSNLTQHFPSAFKRKRKKNNRLKMMKSLKKKLLTILDRPQS